jgi:hypothetical protein
MASLIGKFVSACNGVEYGPLYYKEIEIEKNRALQKQAGNYDLYMDVTDGIRKCLDWWIRELPVQTKSIGHGEPDIVINTDASNVGWGASSEIGEAQGEWTEQEKELHINCLEMYAVLFGLKSLCVDTCRKHVRIMSDNTTTVHYISNMGGVKSVECNEIARKIWRWCIDKHIWLSVAFVKGCENVEADYLSRVFDERTEWMLDRQVFRKIVNLWGKPKVDLFASRVNKQIERFVSWKPDPEAFGIDAFTLNWLDDYFYAFPPFCMIARCLQKILVDRAEGVLVVPAWTTQVWFPMLASVLIDHPRLILHAARKLGIPSRPMLTHPLDRLTLMICLVSGRPCMSRIYQKRLPRSFLLPGDQGLVNNIKEVSTNGLSFVVKGRLIIAKPL